jgi:penicillin G amidase
LYDCTRNQGPINPVPLWEPIMRRIFAIAGLGLLLAALVAVLGIWALLRESLPSHSGTQRLAGLTDEVEILRDDRGVPHLFATSLNDLLFAQGYVHAQDRWFTMDLYRRVATGQLSGLVGADAEVRQNDILMSAIDFPALARRDLAGLTQSERAALQAFADGVNAYLSGRSPAQMALEYRVLALGGRAPQIKPWRPEDSLAIARLQAFALSSRDLTEELHRAEALRAVGPELYAQWRPGYDYTRHPTTIAPADLGLADGNAPPPQLSPTPVVPAYAVTPAPGNPLAFLERYSVASPGSGSNAMVLAGVHTRSGRPAIAIDPHNGIEMPSAWAEIGLHLRPAKGEAMSIYGWAAAPFPLILEGSNGFAAWGTTSVTGSDALDLFALEINPDNPGQYKLDGVWRAFTYRDVTIPVAGGEPVRVRLADTVFGPVLPAARPAYAIAWTGFAPSRLARASLRLPFVRTFDAFRDALADWDLPATHFLFAGRDGDIGIVTTGRFPVRVSGHDGQFPAAGTRSDAAWQGVLTTPDLPSLRNPDSGMIVSGNNPVVPPQWFAALREARGIAGQVDFLIDAARGYRGARITQRLMAEGPHDSATLSAIQSDVTTPEIAAALAVLDGVKVSQGDQPCLATLRQWDGSHRRDSPGALAFAYLWEEIFAEVYRMRLPPSVPTRPGMTELLSLERVLADRSSGWWDDPRTPARETRDDRLPGLLAAACDDLRARHGADPRRWRWDAAFRAPFVNPVLGESGVGLLESIGNRSVAVSGGAATVSVGRYRRDGEGFHMVHLPSYRYVMDLGAPMFALSANSTGQSVHPLSPHYADQMQDWAAQKYTRIDLTERAIRARARARLLLVPANRKDRKPA